MKKIFIALCTATAFFACCTNSVKLDGSSNVIDTVVVVDTTLVDTFNVQVDTLNVDTNMLTVSIDTAAV